MKKTYSQPMVAVMVIDVKDVLAASNTIYDGNKHDYGQGWLL